MGQGKYMPAGTRKARRARSDRTIRRAFELLLRMRPDVLEGVCPLLTDLANVGDEPLREPTLRRVALRMFCVQRYRQVRRSLEHRHLSARRIAELVSREAARIDPAWRCSRRSLQSWLRAWNAVDGDGLAAGWRGLIRPSWTEQRSRDGRSWLAPGHRSPEAIAYFKRCYVDGRGQTVAACHRLTLREARRRGWTWPASCAATRVWLKGGRTGKQRRTKRRPNRRQKAIGRGSMAS